MSFDQLTQVAHLAIIFIALAGYYKSNQAKNLVEIQEKTIAALKVSFEECKTRLDSMEKERSKRS